MQFYRSLPTVEIDVTVPKLEAKTDVWALLNIFRHNINKIMDFECPELRVLDKEIENRYQLARKLALLDYSTICSHDDYLACSSQLEYIGHLRKLLVSLQ